MSEQSQWTVDTSREDLLARIAALTMLINQRFDASGVAMSAALAAADRAVTKAEAAAEKRFESVNEFRAMMDSVIQTLMPRREMDQILEGMRSKIDIFSGIVSEKKGERAIIAGAIGLVTVAVAVVALIVHWNK